MTRVHQNTTFLEVFNAATLSVFPNTKYTLEYRFDDENFRVLRARHTVVVSTRKNWFGSLFGAGKLYIQATYNNDLSIELLARGYSQSKYMQAWTTAQQSDVQLFMPSRSESDKTSMHRSLASAFICFADAVKQVLETNPYAFED